ncbi:MAG: 1-phosphofructokinase family hexose kinase [Kineosporiaceae bacterium]
MLVANPNLCLDRTVRLPELVVGAVHRSREAVVTAGGKGVNVARVLRAHGHAPVVAGLVPSEDGDRLRRLLADEGAELAGAPVTGAIRVATVLVEDHGRVTVVNEPGPWVDAGTWDAYRVLVAERAAASTVLVCTGSLPPGAPADGYGQLVAVGRARGCTVVVDAARSALAGALAAGPDLVTPNLAEAEAMLAAGGSAVGEVAGRSVDQATGHSPEHVDETAEDVLARAAAAAEELVAAGARRAAVTAGAAGVVLALPTAGGAPAVEVVAVAAPAVHVVNPVGAGDSFVAGVVHGRARGEDWVAAVRRGVATASTSCEQLRAGGVDVARVGELLARTAVRSVT